jgi:hypothetical protein
MKIKEMFTAEHEIDPIPLDYLLERFRNWRKDELTATDWTQLPDAPVDAITYATYRQALRDLPSVKNFANAELPKLLIG